MTGKRSDRRVDWSRYADVYDLMAAHNPAYRELRSDILRRVEALRLPAGSTIADLGAGTGQYSLALARARTDWQVVHIEPDAGMNARVAEHLNGVSLANFSLRQTGVAADLFSAGSLDLCVCVHALYTMPAPRDVLSWIQAWLKPGGWLVLCDPGRVLNVGEWRWYIVKHMLCELGAIRTLQVLWAGRQVVRQNRLIAERQRTGVYWTHTLEQLQSDVAAAGFQVRDTATCYRGYSDLIVAQKTSPVDAA